MDATVNNNGFGRTTWTTIQIGQLRPDGATVAAPFSRTGANVLCGAEAPVPCFSSDQRLGFGVPVAVRIVAGLSERNPQFTVAARRRRRVSVASAESQNNPVDRKQKRARICGYTYLLSSTRCPKVIEEPTPLPPTPEEAVTTTTRERSRIAFPYADLDEAVSLADALYRNAGAGSAELHQIAAWVNQTQTSGAFRTKVGAARTFDLIQVDQGRASLTETGRKIVDPETMLGAKVKAFLAVPLYRAIFNKYKIGPLPAPVGLEREMVEMGVALKQRERARQVFAKSARAAGFFAQGPHRLVLPSFNASVTAQPDNLESRSEYGRFGGGGQPPKHPVIDGLIQMLPEPGTVWSASKREGWLNAWKAVLPMLYQDEPEDGTAT